MRKRGLLAFALMMLGCSGEALPPPEKPATTASAPATTSAPAAPVPAPPAFRLPDAVAPVKVAATLTIVPSEDTFRGSIDMDLTVAKPTRVIWMHAVDLQVSAATLDVAGRRLSARIVQDAEQLVGFLFDEELPVGPARLSAAYTGHVLSADDRGVFRESEGSDAYLFSQFENVEARRAFPCLDEPGFKVPWQLTLRVRPSDTALSNTPVLEEKVDADGFKTVRFAPTKPLPSYLVAFAVGPFEMVDAGRGGKNKTPIRFAVQRGRKAEAAFSAGAMPKILDLLEQAFGVPYPYEKLDVVTIPHTASFGAMENAGLITSAATIVLAKPNEDTIDQRYESVAVLAHEAAHQWFGDLVTMKWWDDIWLNEGFATWMEGKATHQFDAAFERDVASVAWGGRVMGQDGLLSARKVRQEVTSYDDITNAFDGITYQKGGALLRMFEAWLGPEAFSKGVRVYLDRFAFKNADANDFLTALGEGAGKDVKAAFSTFLDQPGVPIVSSSLSCDASGAKLKLSQERFLPIGSKGSASASTWQIPVCVRYGAGKESGRACALLGAKEGELALPALGDKKKAVCPDWVLLNEGGAGYYQTAYTPKDVASLLDKGKAPLSASERVSVVQDLKKLAASSRYPMGNALGRLPELLKDPSAHVQETAASMGFWLTEDHVDADLSPQVHKLVAKVIAPRARELGWQAKAKDSSAVRALRRTLLDVMIEVGDDAKLFAEAGELANKWLDDPASVENDSVDAVLRGAAKNGDKKLFDRLVKMAKVEKDTRRLERMLFAAAAFSDPALVRASLDMFLDPSLDPRVAMPLLWGQRRTSRALLWAFFKEKFDAIIARVPTEVRPYIVSLPGMFCDEPHRAEVEAFMKDRAPKITGAPRMVSQALESISLCAARREANKASLRELLKKQ